MNILERIYKHKELKRAYQETFSTRAGQTVLIHLLKVSGVTQPKFATDHDTILRNEAQRHFVLSIFNQVHGSIDKLPDYLVEQLKQHERDQQ
jgi:hypothetical protein